MRRTAATAALMLATTGAASAPDPARWLAHVEEDLAPFWLNEAYAGTPEGAFPTFLCADGRVYEAADPCPSLAQAGDWIRRELGRRYVRMLSRQTFTYGVIFHLTGNERALALARAGTQFIRERAWDPASGSVATFLADGSAGLEPGQRTTQSLAYALLGPAFYYYLTRDEGALELIRSVRDHIFAAYWDEQWNMLRWNLRAAGEDTPDRRELVAQLDQINAYMLLLLPLLEGEERERWEADLRRVVEAMLGEFHDRRSWRFYGYTHEESGRRWGERHNDFGHTAKAYWMVYLSGRLLDETGWIRLARTGLDDALEDALVKRHLSEAPDWQRPAMAAAAAADGSYHVWSNRPDGIGIAAWEWCELDQAAATLALVDAGYGALVEKTYPTWFATMIDAEVGGTYAFPGYTDGAKGHHWLNGYHVAEHALVGYVTDALRAGEPFRLYFAPPADVREVALRAYYFDVPVRRIRRGRALEGGLRETVAEFAAAR